MPTPKSALGRPGWANLMERTRRLLASRRPRADEPPRHPSDPRSQPYSDGGIGRMPDGDESWSCEHLDVGRDNDEDCEAKLVANDVDDLPLDVHRRSRWRNG
jgi:hypothetical protein